MKISASVALFDLGDTLFYDNAAAWPRVYKRAEAALWKELLAAGLPTSPEQLYGKEHTLLSYYYELRGKGIEEPGTFRVLQGLVAEKGFPMPDATIAGALRAMYAVTQSNWRVEAGAGRTLRILKERGLRLAALSNGSDDQNAFELLDKARLRDEFELVLTSAAHGRRKPERTIFEAALARLRVGPDVAVMIGDNYEADILGAHALGLQTIWVTRRVNPLPTLRPVTPDATVSALREIPDLLG